MSSRAIHRCYVRCLLEGMWLLSDSGSRGRGIRQGMRGRSDVRRSRLVGDVRGSVALVLLLLKGELDAGRAQVTWDLRVLLYRHGGNLRHRVVRILCCWHEAISVEGVRR